MKRAIGSAQIRGSFEPQPISVAVAGFAILDNHLHLLVRLDPEVARGWSDEDVVRRWGRLFPPRDKARQVAPVSEEWVGPGTAEGRQVGRDCASGCKA